VGERERKGEPIEVDEKELSPCTDRIIERVGGLI